jgi:hypothetical protein
MMMIGRLESCNIRKKVHEARVLASLPLAAQVHALLQAHVLARAEQHRSQQAVLWPHEHFDLHAQASFSEQQQLLLLQQAQPAAPQQDLRAQH